MLILASTQLFAANVELGKYTAYPKDFPEAVALIALNADLTATLEVELDGLVVRCAGTYNVEGDTMAAHVFCDHEQVPEVNVRIDYSNVTPEGLRSEEGVEVSAQFDLLGDETVLFVLKKAD